MARYRGQKALYEVIGGRARNKPVRPAAEPLRPKASHAAEPVVKKRPVKAPEQPKERVVVPKKEVISWKPKPVQCHDGRLEITLSTRGATMAFLVLTAGLLVCFRAGQLYPGLLIEKENSVSSTESGLPRLASPSRQVPVTPERQPPATSSQRRPAVSPNALRPVTHGNAIVIQQFDSLKDLVAVGQFFRTRGIGTEIVRKSDTYFLITQERFPYNPEAPNTRGSELLQEIRAIGQTYKAPQGLESFAPNKFKGAYGRNIDDQYIGEVTDVH